MNMDNDACYVCDVGKGINETVYDVVIVGGGVVGLAILRDATIAGFHCALIEKDPDLVSWASGSNSGIVCTGVDATANTLERALIRDSISQIRIFCHAMNIPTRQCGSIVCQWEWDCSDKNNDAKQHQLDNILYESHIAGDTHDTLLSKEQVQELEPNISKECCGAIHIQGEIVVDPWLYSIALAVHARQNGAKIYTNFEMDFRSSFYDGKIWTINRRVEETFSSSDSLLTIKAKVLIQATGVWSELCTLEQGIESQFSVRPRRGQYRIYKSNPQTSILHPIQPIPTKYTKGIFVFSTIYNQIVVGPTATEQESLTDRTIDETVAQQLERIVKRIIPELDIKHDYIGDYVGIRPGTNQQDYQIRSYQDKKYIICAGIRSTGLTASLGIGRHITQLIVQTGILSKPLPPCTIQTRPLPTVQEIANMYYTSNYEVVQIDGFEYKVTHPLSKFGLMAMKNG